MKCLFRSLIAIVLVFVVANSVNAESAYRDYPNIDSNKTILFPIRAINDTGFIDNMDSAWVFVRFNGQAAANAGEGKKIFRRSVNTAGDIDSAWIDEFTFYGGTSKEHYYFRDICADWICIDTTATPDSMLWDGYYTMEVTTYTQGDPWQTFYFYVARRSGFVDSVIVDESTIWASTSGARLKAILDTIQTWDDAGKLQPTLRAVLDTLQAYDDAGKLQPTLRAILDTLQVYDNAGKFQALVQQTLDTLQTYDNAGRFQALTQQILDTLQTYDNAGRFQALVQQILDTLQTYDNSGRFQDESGIIEARSDSTKKLLQAVAGRVGVAPGAVIRYVTKQGNDSNDGLSWEKAHLTINDALHNAPADSLVPFYVFVGPGKYDVCTVATSSTHLIGSGAGSTLIYNSSGSAKYTILVDKDPVDVVDRLFGCEIAHLAVASPAQTNGYGAIGLRNADSTTIHHCDLMGGNVGLDCGGFSSAAEASHGVSIYENVVRYADHDGIFAANSQGGVIAKNIVLMDSLMASGDLTGADGITIGRHMTVVGNYVACSLGFSVANSPGAGISEITSGTWKNYVMDNVIAFPYDNRSTYTTFIRRKVGQYSKYADNRTSQRLPFAVTPNASGFTYDSTGVLSQELLYTFEHSQPDTVRSLQAENSSDSVWLGRMSEYVGTAGQMADTIEYIAGAVDAIRDSMDEASATGAGGGGGGNCGAGSQTVTLCALDTSGTDTFVQGAQITLYTSAARTLGSLYANMSTLTGGCFPSFGLNASTTYYYSVTRAGYVFDTNNFTTGSGGTWADTLYGYDIQIGSPSAVGLKRIYDYIYTITGDSVQGAEVFVELLNPDSTKIAYDSVTSVSVGKNPVAYTTQTDASGRYTIDLIPNNYIKPAGSRYQVTVRSGRRIIYSVKINAVGTATAQTRTLQ